ncbi:MAG: dihydroorotase [Proteobacteria bacterium]|nr:dihydroorotase [Pseudomonadota bacterium]
MEQISLIRPDDWHCHLRDGEYLSRTVPDISTCFGRAIIMPNLTPPITTVTQANDYRMRILSHIPHPRKFDPLMTLYLTEQLSATTLREAKTSGFIYACKLYPAGATTHSAAGIAQLTRIFHLLECLEEIDLPLLIHGESIDPEVDIFDREKRFIDDHLAPLTQRFPKLRMVLEHVSTADGVDFIKESSEFLAATITVHHLWFNRNALLAGGIRPHHYCMPVLKTRKDQEALLAIALSGHPRFFLGTDSAPHLQHKKESACGSAGVYSGYSAIELYAQLFEEHQALNKLEKFASINGPLFYRLPLNKDKVTLIKSPWVVPQQLPFGSGQLIPMLAGEILNWQLLNE